MKQTIRFNTFETNSSSTHSCVIIEDKYWEDWTNNKIAYCQYGPYNDELKALLEKYPNKLVPVEEIKATNEYKKDLPKREDYEDEDEYQDTVDEYEHEFFRDDFTTCEEWEDDEWLEFDDTTYTTSSGETIHITCKYGRDG